jgi:hypothetical protein
MSALTRRYIDQVVSHLPDGQREDISRELDALTSDMLDERLAAGAEAATAERAALEELGDPARLAARYRNATNYVIGPELYPVYVRALQWLLPMVLVVALIVNIVVYVTTEPEAVLGAMIGQVVVAMLSALVWMLGTVTVLFWIIERCGPSRERSALAEGGARRWSVEDLQIDVVHAREARSEAMVGLVMLVFLALVPLVPTSFLYVGHLNDGGPFVNQALWDFWLPAYYVFLVLTAGLCLWTVVRGRTSRVQLAVRALLDVVVAVFLTALVLTQEVIDPAIEAGSVQTSGAGDWVDVLYLAVIWLVAVWDLYVCLRYWRTLRKPADTVTAV